MGHLRLRHHVSPVEVRRLVLAYRPLVVSLARLFRGGGIVFEDLVQEGTLGLIVAAQRFDPRRGVRFATYARFWIRAYLLQYAQRFRGPVTLGKRRRESRLFFGLPRTRQRLEREGAVDRNALAQAIGASEQEVGSMMARLARVDVSFDDPKAAVLGRMADPSPSPEERVEAAEARALLERSLPRLLDARERTILRGRYFVDPPLTLATLGRRMHISRERVRQLELRAKSKLRAKIMPSSRLEA
jgi:RNA polymerase sigma-32 factor